jgi:hypothetical protein
MQGHHPDINREFILTYIKYKNGVNMRRFYWFLIVGFLVSACLPLKNNQPIEAPTEIVAAGIEPTQTLEAKISPTAVTTIADNAKLEPAPADFLTALNRTPIPAIGEQIQLSNIEKMQILKQTSYSAPVEILGGDGSRWFVKFGSDGEVHDSKTNEILWKPAGSEYMTMDSTGSQAFLYTENFSKMQILNEKNWKDSYNTPSIDLNSVYLTQNISNRLLAVEQGNSISVYSLGKDNPKYSINGFFAVFTTGEKYLTYLEGKMLVFVSAESGRKKSEFGLGENEYTEITTNRKNIWKTSWDDQYLALSRKGTIEVWRILDRKLIRSILVPDNSFIESSNYVFSKESKSLMVLTPEKEIVTYLIETGEIITSEKSDLTSLANLRVTDGGEIVKFNLPKFDIPGKSWKNEFTNLSTVVFTKDGSKLVFSNQVPDRYYVSTEVCVWDLLDEPVCDFHNDNIWTNPANYRLLGSGKDGGQYYLKTGGDPVSLHQGWTADGKYIAQLPKISSEGYIYDFSYDPDSGILITHYSDGKRLVFNHKTNSRLLLEGFAGIFSLSKDGTVLFKIENSQESRGDIEFVKYDSQTLKEISRTVLGGISGLAEKGVNGESITPDFSSSSLSPDGKNFYIFIQYLSNAEGTIIPNSAFLMIPLDTPEEAKIVDSGFTSGSVSNMVIARGGDLAIISETGSGNLRFINPLNGKIIKNILIGGNPVILSLTPDGKVLIVCDVKDGIKLVGIPAN